MQYGIVGGGMLGMTLALRLAKAGNQVTIFEAASRCGGLASPWQLGDVIWDRHYHVTLYSDSALRAILDEIGLSGDMRWVTTKTGFFVEGRLLSMSDLYDYVRFPPLSPLEKMRLGATILRASRISNWRALERLTAVEWLTRHSGPRVVEKIWLPLLRAKLGTYAEKASAAFIWAIIVRLYAARRSGMKRELFGYAAGGYSNVLDRLERRLSNLGVQTITDCKVDEVGQAADGVAVVSGKGVHRFDRVVVTLAASLSARICPQLSERERACLRAVEYQGIVCASLLTDRPLTRYYVTNITDRWVPFTAVVEMTALVDPREFAGRSLVYLPKYAHASDPIFTRSDAEIEKDFLAALERMYPWFSRESVQAFRLSRVPHVFPVPTLNYSQAVPPLRTSIPGLYLAGSANIVNGTLNVNETVALANRVAQTLIAQKPSELHAVAV